jgi:L-lactate dehydrogenase
VFRIIQAISIDERSVLPVAKLLQGEYGLDNVVISLPTVIGRNGAEAVLHHPFTEGELNTLEGIANDVKAVISDVATKTGLTA